MKSKIDAAARQLHLHNYLDVDTLLIIPLKSWNKAEKLMNTLVEQRN